MTPVPQPWAKVKGVNGYNTAVEYGGTYLAAELCGLTAGTSGLAAQTQAASFFFKPRELSNARNTVPEEYTNALAEWFIRDVSVTTPSIMGEWGDLTNYSNSGFYANSTVSRRIWTNASHSTEDSRQFSIGAIGGGMGWLD